MYHTMKLFIKPRPSWRLPSNPLEITRIKGESQMSSTTTSSRDCLQPKKDPISQGHVNDPSNLHKQDVQNQSAESGKNTRKTASGGPLDAANARGKKDMRPEDMGKGNPEGVGMVDQVGSASASARHFEKK